MAARQKSRLLESPLVRVFDVCCGAHRSGFGEHEISSRAQIVLPRRGVFFVARGGEVAAIDTNTAVVLGRATPYRTSHPADGGDDTTVFEYSPELHVAAFGHDAACEGMLRAEDQLALFRIRRLLAEEFATPFEREEYCMLMLQRLTAVLPRAAGEQSRLGPGQRLRVHRVKALLASEPTKSWDLARVASAVDSSPFHLARQFRSLTGETIARYLLRLRLAIAIQRLAEGEDDLMRLACELGFSHHSHFSARFRAVFGLTPSAVRRSLTGTRIRELANDGATTLAAAG